LSPFIRLSNQLSASVSFSPMLSTRIAPIILLHLNVPKIYISLIILMLSYHPDLGFRIVHFPPDLSTKFWDLIFQRFPSGVYKLYTLDVPIL
jgi:hypothetical protein